MRSRQRLFLREVRNALLIRQRSLLNTKAGGESCRPFLARPLRARMTRVSCRSDRHVGSLTQKGRPVRGGLSISEARGAISLEVDQTADADVLEVFSADVPVPVDDRSRQPTGDDTSPRPTWRLRQLPERYRRPRLRGSSKLPTLVADRNARHQTSVTVSSPSQRPVRHSGTHRRTRCGREPRSASADRPCRTTFQSQPAAQRRVRICMIAVGTVGEQTGRNVHHERTSLEVLRDPVTARRSHPVVEVSTLTSL